ncbi:MAG: NAD-dependent epimerase/dehydratase family protein [Thermodesulfobacteriota bacterium]
MKVGITGATGFIGGRLLKRLLSEGHEVKCLVRDLQKGKTLEKLGAKIYEGDLSNLDSLKDFPKDCEFIYHIAAMVSDWGKKYDFYKNNVQATKVLLEASKKYDVKRFIFMSSSTVVWNASFWKMHNLEDINEVYPCPKNYNDAYNESKSNAEKLVVDFYRSDKLETVVIRPSNVWGAGDMVILPRIVNAAKKRMLIPMGSGKNIVTPCHVDNLVESIMLVTRSENAAGKVYFINDGQKIEYYQFLKDQLKAAEISWEPKFRIPYKIGYLIAMFLELIYKIIRSKKPPVLTRFAVAALSGTRSYSILRAKKDLEFETVISYSEGMKRLREWVINIGGKDALTVD